MSKVSFAGTWLGTIKKGQLHIALNRLTDEGSGHCSYGVRFVGLGFVGKLADSLHNERDCRLYIFLCWVERHATLLHPFPWSIVEFCGLVIARAIEDGPV